MDLFTEQKINEGVHIDGKGKSIDVILRKVGGSRRKREAYLEISGVEGLHTLKVAWYAGLIEIVPGVDIEVVTGANPRSDRVKFHYDMTEDFLLSRRRY